jgi:hypothetical protein
MHTSRFTRALLAVALLAPAGTALHAQSLEGSKWSIEQEGSETAVLWWLGSQGRVRNGDVGTILSGYKWHQAGDSVIVTIGDTVRYAGVVMTNRVVGIRTGRRQPEGWWSGARADGPDAVAAVTGTAAATGTEQMARPVSEPTSVPTSPASTTTSGTTMAPAATAAAPRTLQRIEREGASTPASSPAITPASGSQGGGREIRRIERSTAAMDPTRPVPADQLVGRWVPADSGGVITALDLRTDGSGSVGLSNGNKGNLEWSNESEGTRLTIAGNDRSAVLRAWMEGSLLNVVVLTASGPRRTWRFRRGG